jgi:hypothetical protein
MNDRTRDDYDLNQLLHPAQAFGHPSKVVNDQDLTLREARHSRILGVGRLHCRSVARSALKIWRPSSSVQRHYGGVADARCAGQRLSLPAGAPSPWPAAAQSQKSLGSQWRLSSVANST